ncbi:permease [Halorhabdus sp. BNX81]|uniref:DUF7139 domain-containing protein n=1 Tax=Halorhabdus sp. BNX81 TaxID=2980181 RepID=UPI0023DD13BC|nr:permease [Halorhabdus sp. BNX81]WEL21188.1 putative membrane protein [Halorhabdus sp. BNX81]
MSGDGPSTNTEEPEPGDENGLVATYRRYVRSDVSRREIYSGFGLFFAGVTLGIAAFVVFLYSGTYPTGSEPYWYIREVAIVAGSLMVPAVSLSVVILLPVGRRTRAVSAVGTIIILLSVVWFTQVYPWQWSSANDMSVISLYAAGVALLVGATGAALVAQYVDRVTEQPGEDAQAGGQESSADDVSDEDVRADIDDAMADSSLTWGGVETEPTTKRLKFDMPDAAEVGNVDETVDAVTETRSASGSVDDAVDGLRKLQGGEDATARAESPDEQVSALAAMREQQQAEADVETGVERPGLIARLRERVFGGDGEGRLAALRRRLFD